MTRAQAIAMAVLLSGCPSPPKPCSISNCSGCCDTSGKCQTGNTNLSCGLAGSACAVCGGQTTCVGGTCTGPSGTDGGNCGGGGAPIVGTRILHWISAAGTVDAPDDPARYLSRLSAWAPDTCSDAGYKAYPAVSTGDGGWTITGVPNGPYFLHAFDSYFAATTRSWDLGAWAMGRPDQQDADAGTTLALSVSGLAPWQATLDDLELFSENAGLGYWSLQLSSFLSNAPDAGDTRLSVAVVDYTDSAQGAPVTLVNAARGDAVVLTDLPSVALTVQTDAGPQASSYNAVSASLTESNLTVPNGGEGALAGALTTLGQTSTTVNVKMSQFELAGAQSGPGAIPFAGGLASFFIDAMPDTLSHGGYTGTPDLVEALALPSGMYDQTLTFQYGNPYPAAWPLFGEVEEDFAVPVSLGPDGGAPVNHRFVRIVTGAALASFTGGPVAPLVWPVRNVRLGGQPASGNLTGVTATPVLAWDAPATGTAAVVYAKLYQFQVNGTALRATYVATFATNGSQISLPPGILSPGATYGFTVTAEVDPATQVDGAPYQYSWPYARADAVTGLFTP